ncbi:MAG TPA: adenylate/guanylate cyclase domain-containing protein [Thermoleophilaceae bacterium]|nr:adenylate/guanylate cyclase domain-containing protein [Thermoleophilaceae bacterium]
MRTRHHRLRTILFLSVGLGLTALGVGAYATDALGDLERDTVDARFSIRGEQERPRDLIVVEIDDVTFSDTNERWPFPRAMHAKVIDRIAADDPKVIAYDVQFSEPSNEGEEDDLAFAEAIQRADKRVVLATTEVNRRGEGKFLGVEEDLLRDLGGRFGNGLFPNDPGGVIRRTSFAIDKLETFGVAAVEVAEGRQVERGEFDDDGAWIDYVGSPGTIETISFSRVLNGEARRGMFKDKLVVVGPSAPSLQDLHPTSTSGDNLMAGAEIQANAISTVQRDLPLKEQPAAFDIALILLLGLAAPVASLQAPPLRALAMALGAGVVFTILVQLLFNGGTIVSFVYPVGTLLLVSVGVLAVHYLTTAFERERMRDMFSRFVPENVVDDVIASADGLRLGGVQREGTVMFSDLRGFTSFAESMPPDQVIEVLNRYLTEMSDAILDHGGTLVAYMGDGIMAVFGAPVPQEDHADRALAAAREMLGPRLDRFNQYLRDEGIGQGFRMGVGLNSGRVMSGNVGSERRLEYTAIGDTTNTAARLEGMTKGTAHMLFLADSTRELLKEEPEDLIYVDEFEVRGRQAKIKLWSLAGRRDGEEAPGPPSQETTSRSA